jgi:hypothetical protein
MKVLKQASVNAGGHWPGRVPIGGLYENGILVQKAGERDG